MPKLTFVAVEGLLGRFDHRVAFEADWEFVILHGPNGVGKTKLLELIHSVLSGQLERLLRIPFKTAELQYEDGSRLAVTRDGQPRLPGIDDERDAVQLLVELQLPGQGDSQFQIAPIPDLPPNRLRAMEHELPVDRIGQDEWFDASYGDQITTRGVIERYAGNFPQGYFAVAAPNDQPKEFREFIDQTPVHLIETQRLLTSRPWRSRPRMEVSPITVMRYSKELTERLSAALADNSTTSQRLDRTFPKRVLEASAPEVTDEQIRERYAEQGKLRDRLEAVSLLDAAAADVPLPGRELEEWERIVLWTYLEDTEEKLATFQPLLDRTQLLQEIVNSRFLFKELAIDRQRGFRFKTHDGQELGAGDLSSGEQHELVLAYDLLFNVEKGSLVLIDEPEISLHVSWQQQFLADLVRISGLQSLRFVIATHSPQIINKWWDRAKTLYDDAGIDAS